MAMKRRIQVYSHAGLGGCLGVGERPAILAVDLQLGFTRVDLSPLAGDLDDVISDVNLIIAAAHQKNAPVVFSVLGYPEAAPWELGLWADKVPTLRVLKLESTLTALDPRLSREPADLVVVKRYASAFCGTLLASYLTAAGIDTLIVTGCTTSGCVRASVTDALFSGFRPIVPIGAVGDRASGPHEANLFDMSMKYADVVSTEDVLEYLMQVDRVESHNVREVST